MKNIFAAKLLIALPILIFIFIAGGCGKSEKLPNIILISIDTLRADHLSCYGYKKKTTPMIDLLAEKGVRFSKAYSTSPWTLPSHASMFTGLYPTKHNAVEENFAIEKKAAMLAQRFQDAGYATGGFVSHYYLSKDYGFDRGFDKFEMQLDDATADKMIGSASKWIRDNRKKSFFAFIHLFDVHTPYTPPLKFAKKYYPSDMAAITGSTRDVLSVVHQKDPIERRKMLRALTALYDGEIDFVDSQIAALFKKLQVFKLDKKTLIVIVSDHGEEFFEHGLMEHGFTLYDEQIHIPFIFYCPKSIAKGRVVDVPVSLVDLMPTLLDYAGLQKPTDIDGLSLLKLIEKPIKTPDGLSPMETPEQLRERVLHAHTTRQGPDRMCVLNDGIKYIYSPRFKLSYREFGPEMYNLISDQNEQENIIEKDDGALAEKYLALLLKGNMYKERKVWHVRWAGTKGESRYNGNVTTLNRIIAGYKNNVIYDTDADGKLVAREFLWKRKEGAIRFIAFGEDGENGFSMVPDPPDAKLNFFLFKENKDYPKSVHIGKIGNNPDAIPVALDGDIPRVSKELPKDGYLIWNSMEYMNANVVGQFEIGDKVQPSSEMRERLRALGYLSGN